MGGLAGYLAGENDGPGGTSMPDRRRGPKPRKPCRGCGGPKQPGRGRRLCDTCERLPHPPTLPTPCHACGTRENKRPKRRFCDDCKVLRDWRKQTRTKSRNLIVRRPCPRCGRRKSAGKGKQYCDACQAANRQPALCRNCRTNPVRGPRKRICVECHEESKQRAREYEAQRALRLTREGRAQPVKRASYLRMRNDPERWARALETRRLRYHLQAVRQGREIRSRHTPLEAQFDLPARPLALVFAELAETSDLGTICMAASVLERAVSRWRTGAVETIAFTEADEILTALDLLWWEVWREDTVRRPLFVVHVYAHQLKTKKGVAKRYRVKQHRLHYGDAGPDSVALAEIAARMSGEAMAA